MKKTVRFALLVLGIVGLTAGVVSAQKRTEGSMRCDDGRQDNRLQNHCEINEQTLSPGGKITVDGRENGGMSIKGWERNEILLRSRIQTRAPTQPEADQLAKEVRIESAGLNIHAEGPASRDDYQWYVSYEIFVPRRSDLSLQAHNGGISITDVSGAIDFKTTNGGVSLRRVGGAVRGSTTNGGVHVELAGLRWDGEELNVRTTNGGVNIEMPANYSAHLETGTVNGNVSSDLQMNVPLTERGRLPKDINVDLGSGGPTIRAMTTNGGVRLGRASSSL
jgi:hypothetical protein